MISPLRGGIAGRRYNKTLHGRSIYRRQDVPGHNVVLGYSRPGVGDALDIFVPAGEPVFAMHDGRISRIADRGGRLSCVYVAGRGMTTVYAHLHIRERITFGMRVHEGELIGWVGRKLSDPHLHLEVWRGGKALAGRTAAKLCEAIQVSFVADLRAA
ncbi:MAG: M23 family metallopeptidase [Armatimonadetes bacterium]|nr:M23 family metallopeptidase [Armatimonadota bacterium]